MGNQLNIASDISNGYQ